MQRPPPPPPPPDPQRPPAPTLNQLNLWTDYAYTNFVHKDAPLEQVEIRNFVGHVHHHPYHEADDDDGGDGSSDSGACRAAFINWLTFSWGNICRHQKQEQQRRRRLNTV